MLFWHDLSDAGLIEGSFTTATDAPVTDCGGASQQYLHVPDAKVGVQTSVVAFSLARCLSWWTLGMCMQSGRTHRVNLLRRRVRLLRYCLNRYNVADGAYDRRSTCSLRRYQWNRPHAPGGLRD